jgi:dihydroorotase
VHFTRLSARRSVELVREAKQKGVAATAAVTPWHLALTAGALCEYDVNLKLAAPLRDEADRRALLEGLSDGAIDAVASDHQPENIADKALEFDAAQPGAIGVQTALPLLLDRVRAGELPLDVVLRALVDGPRRVLGLPAGDIAVGRAATLTVFDPEATWTLDARTNCSKSRNTVLWGRTLRGRVTLTLLRGRVVYKK